MADLNTSNSKVSSLLYLREDRIKISLNNFFEANRIFEKEIFKKTDVVYAQFQDKDSIFWGRKTKYIVKNMPLSVMEVFLIN